MNAETRSADVPPILVALLLIMLLSSIGLAALICLDLGVHV